MRWRGGGSSSSGVEEGATNTCATPFAFYHPAYPDIRGEADALFEAQFDGDRMFRMDPDAVVEPRLFLGWG